MTYPDTFGRWFDNTTEIDRLTTDWGNLETTLMGSEVEYNELHSNRVEVVEMRRIDRVRNELLKQNDEILKIIVEKRVSDREAALNKLRMAVEMVSPDDNSELYALISDALRQLSH